MSSDLRNWCSPIRDQGQCGSCTAFGTIGDWEPLIRVAENNPNDPIDLSERDLFFCSGGTCETGNTMDAVLNQTLKGVCTEACCPYDGLDHACGEGRCPNWQVDGKVTKAWQTVTGAVNMKALLLDRPLVSTMEVHQSFMNYVSGVYHSLGLFDPVLGGHCIAIVGFDDGLGAWLVRNSWGAGWGISGYAWVRYGDSAIDDTMYQLMPDGPIPPAPTPSPCPFGNWAARIANFFLRLVGRKGRFYYMNPAF